MCQGVHHLYLERKREALFRLLFPFWWAETNTSASISTLFIIQYDEWYCISEQMKENNNKKFHYYFYLLLVHFGWITKVTTLHINTQIKNDKSIFVYCSFVVIIGSLFKWRILSVNDPKKQSSYIKVRDFKNEVTSTMTNIY